MNDIVKAGGEQALALLEQVVIGGDLAKLNPKDRLAYYSQVCQSVGLNPLTKPFDYIQLNGKLTLYAKRDCTDQLRDIKHISIQIVGREIVGDIYIVTARATKPGNGRTREDESTGAVSIAGLKGENLANAYMKAETKAKRRVTLSIAGLGMLDESEIADVDPTTGDAVQRSEAPVTHIPAAKTPERITYPAEQFTANLPTWTKLIESGTKKPEQIINMVQTKFILSEEQLKAIRALKAKEEQHDPA